MLLSAIGQTYVAEPAGATIALKDGSEVIATQRARQLCFKRDLPALFFLSNPSNVVGYSFWGACFRPNSCQNLIEKPNLSDEQTGLA